MGIYFSKIRSILEVKRKINGEEEDLDDENGEQESEEDQETNDTDEHEADSSPSDYSMDIENDESDDPEEDQETNDTDEHEADNSASDYSMDLNDENEESEQDSEQSAEPDSDEGYSMNTDDGDTSSDSESDDTSDQESDVDEIKSLENDLFKDITPEQMNIKILELKKQYLEVYSTITDILTRTNKIQKTTQNIKVLEFIINKLMELKDIVQFYLSNTFDTKSYMENMVNYQQYLVTLNTINRLLKEINVKKGK